MKAALAVVTAILVFIFAWAALGTMMFAIQFLAIKSGMGGGLLHLFHQLLTWGVCPAFGAFSATLVTPRIFPTISPATICTSFISVVATLMVLLFLLAVFLYSQEKGNLSTAIVIGLQAIMSGIGARWGNSVHDSKYA